MDNLDNKAYSIFRPHLEAFLLKHGSKIRFIRISQLRDLPIFDLCPNMTHLSLHQYFVSIGIVYRRPGLCLLTFNYVDP